MGQPQAELHVGVLPWIRSHALLPPATEQLSVRANTINTDPSWKPPIKPQTVAVLLRWAPLHPHNPEAGFLAVEANPGLDASAAGQ